MNSRIPQATAHGQARKSNGSIGSWRRSRGFTLVELLIAIAIMAALLAIAIPNFQNYRYQAQIAQAIADIRNIEISIRTYKAQNNAWPADLATLAMSNLPTDPWGNAYQYYLIEGASIGPARKDHAVNPINSDFDLYSKGADGQTQKQVTNSQSLDDIIRATDGRFLGLASDF